MIAKYLKLFEIVRNFGFWLSCSFAYDNFLRSVRWGQFRWGLREAVNAGTKFGKVERKIENDERWTPSTTKSSK